MPIYEYECNECGHLLEVLQRVNDPPKTDCPSCNASSLRKLVSAAGFRLKGTGWYETDFKNKPATQTKSSGDKSDKKEKPKSDTSSKKSPSSSKSETKST